MISVTDWIQKIKTNENEALREIYHLMRHDSIVWLQKEFGLTSDDAVDIFQMSVIALYDNVATGRLSILTSTLQTYLYSIARHKAMEHLRAQKRYVYVDPVQRIIIDMSEPSDHTHREVQLTLACRSLEDLGEPCQSLLVLYYYHDKSMDEITTIMNYKNSDTTKNQKYKCLKRLQNIFFSHIQKSLEH